MCIAKYFEALIKYGEKFNKYAEKYEEDSPNSVNNGNVAPLKIFHKYSNRLVRV